MGTSHVQFLILQHQVKLINNLIGKELIFNLQQFSYAAFVKFTYLSMYFSVIIYQYSSSTNTSVHINKKLDALTLWAL